MSTETNPAEPDAVTFMGRPVKQPEVVVFTAEPDTGDVEALGRIIWETSRADESTISVTGANIVARAVLASDWLAEVRRTAAKETAERIAQAIEARRGWGPLGGWLLRGHRDGCGGALAWAAGNWPEGGMTRAEAQAWLLEVAASLTEEGR